MLTKHCFVQNPSTDNLSAADIYRSKKLHRAEWKPCKKLTSLKTPIYGYIVTIFCFSEHLIALSDQFGCYFAFLSRLRMICFSF